MASWLKVAEDLFEVVDRQAKLVVGELGDEQSETPPLVTGRDAQTLKARTKEKSPSKPTAFELPKSGDTEKEKSIPHLLGSEVNNKVESPCSETKEATLNNFVIDSGKVTPSTYNFENNIAISTTPKGSVNDFRESITTAATDQELFEHENSADAIASTVTAINPMGTLSTTDNPIISSLPSKSENIEPVNGEHHIDGGTKVEFAGEESILKVEEEKPEANKVETKTDDVQGKIAMEITEEPASEKKMNQKEKSSAAKVQDQLDEAQGLLKTAISTGQSKEARLARVCAGLSSRLQEYKSENAQLEELLISERNHRSLSEARIQQLQLELSVSRAAISKVETEMADAFSSKNAEIEVLLSTVDALKKQAAASEEKLGSLQASMETIMRSRELTETRVMQALREELSAAERRAEEERTAHNASKMAFMEREVELERRAVEASTALSRLQRIADERTSKALELENKISMLEAECASLNQELQEAEARARRGQKRSPEEANKAVQAWQEEADRARQGQREAESKLSSLEAELQKMRVEMAGMKRDAEHYSRQEHMELEKRYRELTDLLYLKQTQLEAMASDKTAAEFQLEKEVKRLREAQVEVERSKAIRRTPSPWEEEIDVRALEALPLHHRHMVGARMQLQKAAKFLDSGAVHATKFLWRYPVARIIFLFYLVFVHVFLLYLLHRLQYQADDLLSSKEVADSLGLVKSELP